jgi:DeoR family fructose operon transcriptional repressor
MNRSADGLPPEVRREKIVAAVLQDGGAAINDLARMFNVSPVTVHRDLNLLAERGQLARVHGGARALDGSAVQPETSWTRRMQHTQQAKQEIAARAIEWVVEGSTVFIDHSTTSLMLMREVERKGFDELTVVTNSPAVINEFQAEFLHVIATPGEVDGHLRMIGGAWTAEFLRGINISAAFISGAAFTPEAGLTSSQRVIADTLRAAVEQSLQAIALVDSTKWGRVSMLPIAQGTDFAAVVTDSALPPEERSACSKAHINLVIADG